MILKSGVANVIDAVGLTQHKGTMIKSLSGGQRKRASIALELLSDPNIFFLDEPASGLDPGTEKQLMDTLRAMTVKGKTIVFVTHSTLYLPDCDKIIFMGAGGNLCYYGTYKGALEFFGTDNIVDVYNLISSEPGKWKQKFLELQKRREPTAKPPAAPQAIAETKEFSNRKWIRQILVLSKRYAHTLMSDKGRLALVLGQAPILGALISVHPVLTGFMNNRKYAAALVMYFILACAAFWVGISNAIQEVCKERNVLKREYMTGVKLDTYVLSKLLVMLPISAIQAFLLYSIVALVAGTPPRGLLVVYPYAEMLVTCFLTIFAASAMGIFISALSKDAAKAMALAPILMVPQLLFSGAIIPVESPPLQVLSWATICRWPLQAYGSIEDFKAMAVRDDEQAAKDHVAEVAKREKLPQDSVAMILKSGVANVGAFKKQVETRGVVFAHNQLNLLATWTILCGFIVCFSVGSTYALRNINKESSR
jgi:energy-coupling factor transporter ATP-binding protein EcfA2